MMRALVLACSGVLAAGTLAWGADLPPSYPPPARAPAAYTPPPPQTYNWTSVYIGGNAGYGFATATASATGGGISDSASETLSGVIGGLQVGANYQFGWAVAGIEADIDFSGQSNTTTISGVTATDKIEWIGTVRGRFGAGLDRFFPYVTAGGGWGQAGSTITTGFGSASGSNSRFVWTVGGGLEVGLLQNLSARIEYLYLDTGHFNIGTVGPVTVTGRIQDNLVRAGLNLRLPL